MADIMEGLVVYPDSSPRRSSCDSLSSSINCVNLSAQRGDMLLREEPQVSSTMLIEQMLRIDEQQRTNHTDSSGNTGSVKHGTKPSEKPCEPIPYSVVDAPSFGLGASAPPT